MTDVGAVAEHYSSGTIWDRLAEALVDDGIDLDSPTVSDLAPYDQSHGRGFEATNELADSSSAHGERSHLGCRVRSRWSDSGSG